MSEIIVNKSESLTKACSMQSVFPLRTVQIKTRMFSDRNISWSELTLAIFRNNKLSGLKHHPMSQQILDIKPCNHEHENKCWTRFASHEYRNSQIDLQIHPHKNVYLWRFCQLKGKVEPIYTCCTYFRGVYLRPILAVSRGICKSKETSCLRVAASTAIRLLVWRLLSALGMITTTASCFERLLH